MNSAVTSTRLLSCLLRHHRAPAISRLTGKCLQPTSSSSVLPSFHLYSTAPSPAEDGSASKLATPPNLTDQVPPDQAMPAPPVDGGKKQFSEKITRIVEDIAGLTLGEVTELNEALKVRLNLPDVAAMPVGAAVAAAPSAGAATEAAEEEFGETKKTSFSVKLLSFADDKKIALIKEIKNSVAGYNLVQAKKFVESLPQTVKFDIGKDEAEKLQKLLEGAGGKCEIE